MNINYPDEVQRILNILESYGYEGYIVGGCTRDSLLDRIPNDWDICTNATPEIMVNIFNSFKTIPTGLKHGTITVRINNKNFEVTTYRLEKEYLDNRRPSNVEFTDNIYKDLSRRDFTINSMAYNNRKGLIDPYDGNMHLRQKTICSVGNPSLRFQEDSLRILRGVRFATQLGFIIDKDTYEAMYKNRKLLMNISKERIRDEFNKILLSDIPSKGIDKLIDLELIDYIIPELKACIGFEQRNPNHDKDVFKHIMTVLDNTEPDLILRLAALFHDIGKPRCFTVDENGRGHFYRHHLISMDMTGEILRRLNYDNKTIEAVETLVKEHMSRYEFLRPKSTKKYINKVGIENLERMFKLQIADIKGSKPPHDYSRINSLKQECEKVINEKQPLTIKDLNINGKDILDMGYEQGKDIGEILKYLLEIVLENPEMNNKERLKEFIIKQKVIEKKSIKEINNKRYKT